MTFYNDWFCVTGISLHHLKLYLKMHFYHYIIHTKLVFLETIEFGSF